MSRPNKPTEKGVPSGTAVKSGSTAKGFGAGDREEAMTVRDRPPVRDSMDDANTAIFDSGNFKKETSTPIEAISMKTPGTGGMPADEYVAQPTPALQRPKLRAISEVTPLPHAQPANLGYLAPPRNAADVRARKIRDYVLIASLSVILASVIALVVWFLGR